MKNFDNIFDRDKKNTSRESDFKRRDSGKKRFGGGDRDRGRPQMHDATCSECGRKCQVPFMPTNDKPVYCSECFTNRGGGSTNDRPERRDRERERPRFQDKKMFGATCATCGRKFELPFQPSEDRPVYCKDCFDRGGESAKTPKTGDQYKQQLDLLNVKLDRILDALISSGLIKEDKKESIVEKKEVVADKTLLRSNGAMAGKKEKPKKSAVGKTLLRSNGVTAGEKEKLKKKAAIKKEVEKKPKKIVAKKADKKKKAKK